MNWIIKIIINGISAKINRYKVLLFADDLKMCWDIKSVDDCKALQADSVSKQQWYIENCIEINIQKIKLHLSHVIPSVSTLVIVSRVS